MASSSTPVDIDFPNMPPRTADLDETWAFLSRGVEHIMTNFELGLSFKGYTNLYSTVYNYCTSTKMHGKLDGNRSTCFWAVPLIPRCTALTICHSSSGR
jgi:cullin 1